MFFNMLPENTNFLITQDKFELFWIFGPACANAELKWFAFLAEACGIDSRMQSPIVENLKVFVPVMGSDCIYAGLGIMKSLSGHGASTWLMLDGPIAGVLVAHKNNFGETIENRGVVMPEWADALAMRSLFSRPRSDESASNILGYLTGHLTTRGVWEHSGLEVIACADLPLDQIYPRLMAEMLTIIKAGVDKERFIENIMNQSIA
jgi:hypothetical protein